MQSVASVGAQTPWTNGHKTASLCTTAGATQRAACNAVQLRELQLLELQLLFELIEHQLVQLLCQLLEREGG